MATKRNKSKTVRNASIAGNNSISAADLFWPVWTGNEGYWAIEEFPECPDIHVLENSSRQYNIFKNRLKEGKLSRKDLPAIEKNLFWRSLSEAEEVYIIDNYFLENCLDTIIIHQLGKGWLASNLIPKKLHLFSRGTNLEERREEMMKMLEREYGVKECHISCYGFEREILHDRIVLMNSNLWFCGVSTGGFYGGLHVLTGPWPDKKNSVKSLCEALIRKASKEKLL